MLLIVMKIFAITCIRTSFYGAYQSLKSLSKIWKFLREEMGVDFFEDAGLGIAEGVILATAVVLLAAFIMLDKARGSYGEGMFFKNQTQQSN